jgi:hypothetical protein
MDDQDVLDAAAGRVGQRAERPVERHILKAVEDPGHGHAVASFWPLAPQAMAAPLPRMSRTLLRFGDGLLLIAS